jgi:NAD(P)-dependent dehydrogenase (short-subunit alcohol dehydrogenase family)
MDLRLGGRTALVTGASKGIGLAVADCFAAEGCNVVLAARSADRLGQEAERLRREYSVKVGVHAGDLTDPAVRDAMVAAHPDIDILVNNAGVAPRGSLEDIDDATLRQGWELKVFAYISLMRAYLAHMKARRSGVIVNVIGSGGERPTADSIVVGAGNATLMAFTRAIGATSPEYGVRVVGVNPGSTATDRQKVGLERRAKEAYGDASRWAEFMKTQPFGRYAKPEEVAAAVVFLASDLSGYTTGSIVTLDGGANARR